MPRKGGVPENLRPCKKGEVRNPTGKGGGQKHELLPILRKALNNPNAKALGMTKRQVEEWESTMITLSPQEIKAVISSPDTPSYAVNLGMAIISDIKNGRTITIDKLRDRIYGKIADKVELSGANGADLFKGVTISAEQIDRLQVLCRNMAVIHKEQEEQPNEISTEATTITQIDADAEEGEADD